MKGRPAMFEMAYTERDYAWDHAARGRSAASGFDRGQGDEVRVRAAPRSRSKDGAGMLDMVKFMAIGVGIAAALIALVVAVALPATEVTRFEVRGSTTLSAAELRSWSGIADKAHLFSVNTGALEAGVSAHPRVSSVHVERHFPNAIIISVSERLPLAVVYARGASGRMEAHCIDGEGYVFAPANAYPDSLNLPVLSGLEIRDLHYGLRLDGPFTGLLASLAELHGTDPGLLSAISELRVVSKKGAPAELLVYPARYRVPVRMRPVLNAGLLKSMMLVLDVVEGQGLAPSIRELDLRTDTFVYKTKEAVSG